MALILRDAWDQRGVVVRLCFGVLDQLFCSYFVQWFGLRGFMFFLLVVFFFSGSMVFALFLQWFGGFLFICAMNFDLNLKDLFFSTETCFSS